MSKHLRGKWLVRAVILAFTIALTWGALLIGQERADITVTVGQPAPIDFIADRSIDDVPNDAATEQERAAAAEDVDLKYKTDPEVTQAVQASIGAVFDAVEDGVYLEEGPVTEGPNFPQQETTTTSSTTTSTVAEGEQPASTTTTTQQEIQTGEVAGFVFLDADGDGAFDEEMGDAVLAGTPVTIIGGDGQVTSTPTDATGNFTAPAIVTGDVIVYVAGEEARLEHFSVSTAESFQGFTLDDGEAFTVDPIGFAPLVRDMETQKLVLRDAFPLLQDDTIATLTDLATSDAMRQAQGLSSHLSVVRQAAANRADQVLSAGIEDSEQLRTAIDTVIGVPPTVVLGDVTDPDASRAAGQVIAVNLQINKVPDEAQTEEARNKARDDVEPVFQSYREGGVIVAAGEEVTELHKTAIEMLGLLHQTGLEVLAMLAVVTLLVGMLSFYLARFREQFWANTRRVALFGVLIALAAVVARLIVVLTPDDNLTIGFLIPAATFGFMAAILFDARIGVIMSMAVGALTAIATRDPGLALFALLSTMTPIPFVSSISARGDLRRAIVFTAMALTPMAAAIAWFFQGPEFALNAALYGFINGFLSGLVGVTAVSFFEIIFDITTTLRLLDLTDRNHPALQMLEEKARGTFNHSLMVGTLGDRAAKSIGANNLLVRASAYYHDLGKTENPQFFIENQFGISNPHDRMPPEESAGVIRQHVIDGIELAKHYRIPALVADSVLAHHGDGIMRYFYHKAIERYGEENVDVDDYRHHGHKPRTREDAILMMADALEGATRAVFADEDPSPEKIRRVVERVVGEKVADGQLSESALTLGDLTRVKEAFVDSLVGHYHQRIPYPDFPQAELPAPADTSGNGATRDDAAVAESAADVELRP